MVKKVDEVSRLSGVSKRTLQYYDDEGILPAKRSEENYRLYDDASIERLWEILWYKELGFNLSEIKDIFITPQPERSRLFEEKIKEIEENIHVLEHQRNFIQQIALHGMIPEKKEANNHTYKEQIREIKEKKEREL